MGQGDEIARICTHHHALLETFLCPVTSDRGSRSDRSSLVLSFRLLCAQLAVGAAIVKQDGVGALYKGLSAGLLRQATYTTARLGIYQIFTDNLVKLNGHEVKSVLPASGSQQLKDAKRCCADYASVLCTRFAQSSSCRVMSTSAVLPELICGMFTWPRGSRRSRRRGRVWQLGGWGPWWGRPRTCPLSACSPTRCCPWSAAATTRAFLTPSPGET